MTTDQEILELLKEIKQRDEELANLYKKLCALQMKKDKQRHDTHSQLHLVPTVSD